MKKRGRLLVMCLLISQFFLWNACQEDDGYPNEARLPAGMENRYATLFLQQMQEHMDVYGKFSELLAGYEPRYDWLQLKTHSDFGLCYFVPYSRTSHSRIEGAVYFPIGAEISTDGKVEMDGTLGVPVRVDARVINQDLVITKRFLYSEPFKWLQSQGVEVNPELVVYAELLDGNILPISLEESSFAGEPRTKASEQTLRMRITYDCQYVGPNYESVYGLSLDIFVRIVEDVVRSFRLGIGTMVYKCVGSLTVELVTPVEDLPFASIDMFVNELIKAIRREALQRNFVLDLQYEYHVYGGSGGNTGSSGGNNGGSSGGTGGGTGGVSGSTSSGNGNSSFSVFWNPVFRKAELDTSASMRQIQLLAPDVYALFSKAEATIIGDGHAYISLEDYFDAVKNDVSIEHSTTLIKYTDTGEDLYVLTPTIHGTEYNVETDVSSANIIATIHNHPNSSPPSPVDLRFTVEQAVNKKDYQATFVYDQSSGDYYSLIVTDRTKLSALNSAIAEEIDDVTNDFKKGGKIDEFLGKQKNTYDCMPSAEKMIYRLCVVISNCQGGIAVTKYEAKNKRTLVYGVKRERNTKKGTIYYKPLICQ